MERTIDVLLAWAYLHSTPLVLFSWAGGAIILLFSIDPEWPRLKNFLLLLSACSLSFPLVYVTARLTLGEIIPLPFPLLVKWGEGFILSLALVFSWYRYAQPATNFFLARFKRENALERNKRTDVREIHKFLPKPITFNPANYINPAKGMGIFLGLQENRVPQYLDFPLGTSAPHVQIVGTTGAGKGVALGLMASQFFERGEAVFFCDPKNDEWAPHVLFDAAKRTGKPYYFINLNRPNGPQFNPFHQATEDEAFELFQAALGLSDKGGDSDFYGIADRREAGITAKLMAEKDLNIAQAYSDRGDLIEADKFKGRLRELAETPSINAAAGEGVDLAKVIEEGGCVYFVGSMRSDIVKTIQRIVLVRLIQLAERRDRMKGVLRPVCIVLDELKYHISRPALEGLGAARDKGVHLVLAHQSLGDLKDCPQDLHADAVIDAVVENTKLKIVYRVISPDTAEWMASMSGEIQVDDETRKVHRNFAQAEIVSPERNIRQAGRYFIDTNMLLNLPAGVAILYGDGLPKFVSIQPMRVKKSTEAIAICEVAGAAAPTAAEAISLELADEAAAVRAEAAEAAKSISLD